jgi:hypothetical protein
LEEESIGEINGGNNIPFDVSYLAVVPKTPVKWCMSSPDCHPPSSNAIKDDLPVTAMFH